MQLGRVAGLPVGNLLFLGNGQGIDAEVVAYGGDDKVGPAKVHDEGEEKVGPEVVQFQGGADGGQSQARQIAEKDAADERGEHDGPVGEGLARQVGEDDLGGQSAKDKGHGQAEEDEVVLLHEGAVWGVDPGADTQGEDGHGRPLGEDGQHGQTLLAASAGDVVEAEGNVADEEGQQDQADPYVAEGGLAKHGSEAGQSIAQGGGEGQRPDVRAPDARGDHDAAGDEEALGRSIDDAEIEGVGVIGLPCGKEHGEAGTERSEDAGVGGSQTHGGGFEQAGQGTVQGVDSVIEEFAEAARGSGPPRLLPIHVVHGLIHEQAEGEAEVEPCRTLHFGGCLM